MQDVNNIGKQFLSSYGSFELVTVKFLNEKLQKNEKQKLNLSFNSTTKVISISGSSGMSLTQIQEMVDNLGHTVMYRPKIDDRDENGNWVVKLVFAYQEYFEYSNKGAKDEKKKMLANIERIFFKDNLNDKSDKDLEMMALNIFSPGSAYSISADTHQTAYMSTSLSSKGCCC